MAALAVAFVVACGDDETATPGAPTPSATASASATTTATETASATARATETATATDDLRAQFPAEVQEFLATVPDNLVELLWKVRQSGPGTLVWADAGGEFHEGERRAFHNEWEQITGWTLQNAPQSGSGYPADFDTKVGSGNPEWGVVEATAPDIATRWAEAGLLDTLDLSLIAVDKFPQGAPYTDTFITVLLGSTPLVYNTEVYGDNPPTSVLDIFDTATFPGKRCFWGFANSGDIEYAMLAAGVPPEQLWAEFGTAEGRKKGLDLLDSIRDDIVFVESGAESVQFPLDGQCDMGLTWNGRPALRLRDEPDLPLAVVHKDAFVWPDPFVIPMGLDPVMKDAAMSALAYALTPQNQCDFENLQGYGVPMDTSCLDDFARAYGPQPDVAFGSSGTPEAVEVYTTHADELSEEFAAWLTSGQ